MSDGVLRAITNVAQFIKCAVKLNFSIISFKDKNQNKISKWSKESKQKYMSGDALWVVTNVLKCLNKVMKSGKTHIKVC